MRDGINSYDVALTGGTIILRFRGAIIGSPVSYYIESRTQSFHDESQPSADHVTTHGLPLGTYFVSGTQDEHYLASIISKISLTEEQPTATITLDLVERRSSLRITDADGAVISGANVRAISPAVGGPPLGATSPLELSPGVFSLAGLRPGMRLLIRHPLYVPQCRLISTETQILAALEVGRTIEVIFPRVISPAAVAITTVEGIPGSDCPLPLSEFRPIALTQIPNDRSPLMRIDHFPAVERVVLSRTGWRATVIVPDKGPILVAPR